MSRKLEHLKSLADSAHAELQLLSQQLRDTRDRFHAVDRHRQHMVDRGYDLSAPDAEKHAGLVERIELLTVRHTTVRADHRAKRKLADRCEQEVNRGR